MTLLAKKLDDPHAAPARLLTITSIILFVVMVCLRPLMLDGDGLSHASRAIYEGFLEGMLPNHLVAAVVLRCFYLPLEALGLRAYAIEAMSAVSHLATIGSFLLLARVVYPRFIGDYLLSFYCALGVILSFGVLSRGCTIEVYALALLLDVALAAHCIVGDFTRPRAAVVAGILWTLAIGIHVTNLLIGPFVLALALRRAGRTRAWSAIGWAGSTVVVGMAILWVMLLAGQGASLWPPDLVVILPKGAPSPRQGLAGRAARAVYGFFRTLAYLPAASDLNAGLALAYATAMAAVAAIVLYLVWHSGLRTHVRCYGEPALILALIVVPFAVVGLCYYPSDPERWLFLMPVLWLVIGVVWDDYSPTSGSWLGQGSSRSLLFAIVLLLGVYNVASGILPDALADRRLAGFKELARQTSSNDLVITAAGIKGAVFEFFVGKPFAFENLNLIDLANEHPSDQIGAQSELRSRIARQLRSGGRVFAHGLIADADKQVQGRGYPWAFIPDYDPVLFLSVLREFGPEAITPIGPDVVGICQLHLPMEADAPRAPE